MGMVLGTTTNTVWSVYVVVVVVVVVVLVLNIHLVPVASLFLLYSHEMSMQERRVSAFPGKPLAARVSLVLFHWK